MAMGTHRHRQRPGALFYHSELVQAPGHPFYRKLNEVLRAAGFDEFCERECRRFYAERRGRPSLAPGVYFRLMLVGFFEGLDSERAIAWRAADSLSVREFLGYGLDEATPDHVTVSRTRRLIDAETDQRVFGWVLEQLAASAGLEAADRAALGRMDRKRPKQVSNAAWVNPEDAEAEITRLKDGRTALAWKVEEAVDMTSGAILAVTTHPRAAPDTETMAEKVAAGEQVAELIGVVTEEGQAPVDPEGVSEVVADKSYHSN